MKETPRSIRIYFFIVCVFGILGNLRNIQGSIDFIPVAAIFATSLLLAIGYGYFGARLTHYLDGSPKPLVTFLYIDLGYSAFRMLLVLLLTPFTLTTIIVLAISLLITLYLVSNVKRLAKEVKEKATPPTVASE